MNPDAVQTLWLLAASSAPGQLALGAAEPAVAWWRVIGALLLCLGLAAAAALLLRQRLGIGGGSLKLFAKGTGARLQLVERIMFGPQHGVALVKIDGVDFAVLFGPQGQQLLPLADLGDAMTEPKG